MDRLKIFDGLGWGVFGSKRSPDVVEFAAVVAGAVADHYLFVATSVDDDIEAAHGVVAQQRVEIRFRLGRKPIFHDAQGVGGREGGPGLGPLGGEGGVVSDFSLAGFKLVAQFGGGVIGETKVGAVKGLIENRHAQRAGERAPLAGIARRPGYMAPAYENRAGDAAVDWLQKGEGAFG